MPQVAGFMGRSAEGGIKASSAGRAETSLAVAEQVKSASLATGPLPVVVSSRSMQRTARIHAIRPSTPIEESNLYMKLSIVGLSNFFYGVIEG